MTDYIPCPCVECPECIGGIQSHHAGGCDGYTCAPDCPVPVQCPTCYGTDRVLPPVTEENVEAVVEAILLLQDLTEAEAVEVAQAAIDTYRARLGGKG